MNAEDTATVGEHERFMRRCLALAETARSRGNTPVGSLVVMEGAIIGEGSEELPAGTDVTRHAEVLACQSALDRLGSRQLHGATLYTTAEPCFMCSYVIRQCRIALVVYGVETPGIGGITSSHPILSATIPTWSPAPDVIGGILRGECEQLKSRSTNPNDDSSETA